MANRLKPTRDDLIRAILGAVEKQPTDDGAYTARELIALTGKSDKKIYGALRELIRKGDWEMVRVNRPSPLLDYLGSRLAYRPVKRGKP